MECLILNMDQGASPLLLSSVIVRRASESPGTADVHPLQPEQPAARESSWQAQDASSGRAGPGPGLVGAQDASSDCSPPCPTSKQACRQAATAPAISDAARPHPLRGTGQPARAVERQP
jgi:hypothetical protein